MRRRGVVETVAELVGFARIVSAKLGAQLSTLLSVEAHEGDSSARPVELWGHAPLCYRPLAGGEALYVELGDERIVVATKERRYQIAVGDGEVIVRALGAGSPAYLKLRPDGSCEVHASAINLGGAATDPVALSSLVEGAFSSLASALTTAATGLGGDVGAPAATALANAATTWASAAHVAAAKTRAE